MRVEGHPGERFARDARDLGRRLGLPSDEVDRLLALPTFPQPHGSGWELGEVAAFLRALPLEARPHTVLL